MEPPSHSCEIAASSAPARKRWAKALFFVWVTGIVIVLGALMAGHWTTLPKPAVGDAELARRLEQLRELPTEWAAYHVLYGDCPCSRRVLDHVVSSERPTDIDEVVLLIGADERFEARCRQRGLRVVCLSQGQLEDDYGIVAAPILLVINGDGELVYSGGYTERGQDLAVQDLRVIRDLRAGRAVATLPVFGCGVSKSLQDTLDPLGLKY